MTRLRLVSCSIALLCFAGAALHAQPRHVLVRGELTEGFGLGINTSGALTDWLSSNEGSLQLAYPAGQAWGALFITNGEPIPPPRIGVDLSAYQRLLVEMRGALGNERVEIGIKDADDPDDGTETKRPVMLSTEWQTYDFALTEFAPADPRALYVVTEVVFAGDVGATVRLRTVQFRKDANFSGALTGTETLLRKRRKLGSAATTLAVDLSASEWVGALGDGDTFSGGATDQSGRGRKYQLSLDDRTLAVVRARIATLGLDPAAGPVTIDTMKGVLKVKPSKKAKLSVTAKLGNPRGHKYVLISTGTVNAK